MKEWFSLMETMITLLIIGILMWVMFQLYGTIGKIALQGEQQTIVHEETLFMIQTIQNLLDGGKLTHNSQEWTVQWLTIKTAQEEQVTIDHSCTTQWVCSIVLNKDWITYPLTSDRHVHVPFLRWHIIEWGVRIHSLVQKIQPWSNNTPQLPIQSFFTITMDKQ
jgi:hypothetical protein